MRGPQDLKKDGFKLKEGQLNKENIKDVKEKIVKIELTPIHVPFRKKVIETMSNSARGLGMAIASEESWLGGDFVICKLVTASGHIGLGESYIWLPETGITQMDIINIIEKSLSKYVIGESPFNVEKINYRMDINVARNGVAKGLLDIALYDLMGHILNEPAYNLLGGKTVDKVECAALIPLSDRDTMLETFELFYSMGYKTFRIKLGKSPQEDRAIIQMVRDYIKEKEGEEKKNKKKYQRVRLRVDYNQAYTPENAVRSIKNIEEFDIDYAEQPVKASDFLGMAYVQSHVNIPLMAHESFFSVTDFVNMVEMGAVRILGLNTERPGGITKAIKCLDYAHLKGLEGVLHNQPLGIGAATLLHFATAKDKLLNHATEIFGDIMLEDDLIRKPIRIIKGKAKAPKGPGWGVELDEEALDKYKIKDTTTIKL
ncbi:MAG: mandelate racemase/muconate lactonizing enzyme family protein [Promethearchaeota archaeon]